MAKFRAILEYDGTAYHGWQLQPDAPTIQGAVEQGLLKITGGAVRVHGAGRTDAGVHAVGQVGHFTSAWPRSVQELHRALNAVLPRDVAVQELTIAAEDFHARHSAICKTYKYTILNQPIRRPLSGLYAWHINQLLDVNAMNLAAAHLIGSHDFSSFGGLTDGTTSPVRQILTAMWEKDSEYLYFTICGTGFLRYMVRSLVGTMVLAGRGKITPSVFKNILESRDRSKSGPTAPPHGLCLMWVRY
jgi:tRNA pseudouridine38-40 synthase